MRKLYYVRVMHSLEELGSLAPALIDAKKRYFGPDAQQIYEEKLKMFWEEIWQKILEHRLNTSDICQKLHIYADGLPLPKYYCKTCFDKERKEYFMDQIQDNQIQCPKCNRKIQQPKDNGLNHVITSCIEKKIPIYLIIEKLTKKGAKIYATESSQLVSEELEILQKKLKGIKTETQKKDRLLQERDTFIAQRINHTLPENEIGILFMGAIHKVDKELKKFPDIKVIYLKGGDKK